VTSAGGGSGGASAGSINFHLLLSVSSTTDSITLSGGNYDDLIMSNIIAGVMFGHLVTEGYPGIEFNKDYLFRPAVWRGGLMGNRLGSVVQILQMYS